MSEASEKKEILGGDGGQIPATGGGGAAGQHGVGDGQSRGRGGGEEDNGEGGGEGNPLGKENVVDVSFETPEDLEGPGEDDAAHTELSHGAGESEDDENTEVSWETAAFRRCKLQRPMSSHDDGDDGRSGGKHVGRKQVKQLGGRRAG
ncbi:hypothetical protein AXF42_Ash010646 [Apostasia shenzhenica]|uniref:Uncharacterized protein n=1 Tax=Apostasia shenzhenica TaxID=1088818 RepID=A0A2I0A6P9_9ASPA|nr:hypothetical protein AXF42_Ash010646 [Apostasia shenzhenica]